MAYVGFHCATADAAVETLATPLSIRRANHADRQLFAVTSASRISRQPLAAATVISD
jgi:hypothetical protein